MKYLGLLFLPVLLVSAQSHPPLIAIGGVMHETIWLIPLKTDLSTYGNRVGRGRGFCAANN